MYKAIIFDLDGTLIDSVEDIRNTLNNSLKQFGLEEITREQAVAYIGNGAKELVRRALGESNAQMLDKIFRCFKADYAASDNSRVGLFDGECECLERLKAAGIKMAVLTNKPHEATAATVNKVLNGIQFDCVLGQRDGAPLKPDPQGAEEILRKLKVKSEECLMVGDGETDVLTAKNAHLDCIGVLWGYRTKSQLEAAGCTRFASSFAELGYMIIN